MQQQVHDQETTIATTTSSSPDQENTQLAPALGPVSKKPQPVPQRRKPALSSETQNIEKGSYGSRSSEDETVANGRRDPSQLCKSSSTTSATAAKATVEDVSSNVSSGRERLKRHRVEVAGRVWIPDIWGQEGLLKDWIDCTTFDASLANSSIMSARASLVEEGRRANINHQLQIRE